MNMFEPNKVLLIDSNNLAIRILMSLNQTDEINYDLWKSIIFDNIYKMLFKFNNINNVVLAVDDIKSWRKEYHYRYKENRKKNRKKSNIDWNKFFSVYISFFDDIGKYLPFKVFKLDRCEADDIIATIVKNFNNNYVIVSNDEDYLQLLKSNKVQLYSPLKKSFLTCENPELHVIKTALMGQAKHDIYNVKTPVDWDSEKRKPGLGPKTVEKIFEYGYNEWLVKNNLTERFEENRKLIDYDFIPDDITRLIIDSYNNYKTTDEVKLYTFLNKHNLDEHIEKISEIDNKLMEIG